MASFIDLLRIQQGDQQNALARQQFMQDQELNRQRAQQMAFENAVQRENLAKQRANEQAGEQGAGAFMDYFKNPEMMPEEQAMRGNNLAVNPKGYGPDVQGVPVMKPPQMAPMTLPTVMQSLLRRNPNMDPKALSAALERFQPIFDQESKMQLAKFRADALGSSSLDKIAYRNALASGMSPDEALQAALMVKRPGEEEVSRIEAAKMRGKGEIPETEQKATGERQLGGIVDELGGLYDQLDQLGGAVNTEKGALENMAARAGSSALGQFIGGAVGSKVQSIQDKIAQSRPLLINAIRKATGMGAKAMDSNTELQFYLSAATDPTKSIQANRDALARLDQLYGLSGGKAPAAPAATGGGGLPAGWSVQIGQ